jgi:hypothetical protein
MVSGEVLGQERARVTRTPLWWAAPSSEPPTPETVEYVAMRLYEQQICDNSFLRIPWTELDDDEREDVRYQVRSVFDVVESLSPGLLGELGRVVSGAVIRDDCRPEAESEQEAWPLTGT